MKIEHKNILRPKTITDRGSTTDLVQRGGDWEDEEYGMRLFGWNRDGDKPATKSDVRSFRIVSNK